MSSYYPSVGYKTVTGLATPSNVIGDVIARITATDFIAWARATHLGLGGSDNGVFNLQLLADDGVTFVTATSGGIVPPSLFNNTNYWASIRPWSGMLFGAFLSFSVNNIARPYQVRWTVATVPTVGSVTLGFDYL